MSPAMEILNKILTSIPHQPVVDYTATVEPSDSHGIGDFYLIGEDVYVLAQPEGKRVCLIGINGGNRWNDSIEVANVNSLTETEWNRIAPVGRYSMERIYINWR
jgi:hypothetical protein